MRSCGSSAGRSGAAVGGVVWVCERERERGGSMDLSGSKEDLRSLQGGFDEVSEIHSG